MLSSINSVFSECPHDYDKNGEDEEYDFQTSHDCDKRNLRFCYTPKPSYKNLAPISALEPFSDPNFLSDITFSSIYGGCSLSLSGGVLLTGLDGDKYIGFTGVCGEGGFEFGTNVNYRYLLYRENGIVRMGEEEERKVLGTFPFEKDKFRDSVEGGGNFLERGIYTLRGRCCMKGWLRS